MFRSLSFSVAMCAFLASCGSTGDGGSGGARDQIRVVGSSTVYPFATAVAEQFVAKNPGMKAPVIEPIGTGGGFEQFCKGVGASFPDIANASRRIKKSELDNCAKAGVTNIVEIQVGLDGIAFAESKSGPKIPLTVVDVYKALAANPFGKPQTAKTWKDVNPALPAEPIRVYGPPSTSGTRDALAELILTKGCDSDPAMKVLKEKDKVVHKTTCTTIREDGAYVEAGESDNLIVQKIAADPKALGIFGYSFLEENQDKLVGSTLDGVSPTYETIANFSYPGARPLYIYVKGAHVPVIKGLREYVSEFVSASGPDGILKKRGMVIAPDAVRAESAKIAAAMTPLDASTIK